MTKYEILKMLNENPVLHLATIDGDQPRVRGMLLFKAGEDGIIFHTASTKDVFAQIIQNPKAELCFQCGGIQVRVTGTLKLDDSEELRSEIFNHPSREFLKAWKENGIDNLLRVFRMTDGVATVWTMEKNFDSKEFIELY